MEPPVETTSSQLQHLPITNSVQVPLTQLTPPLPAVIGPQPSMQSPIETTERNVSSSISSDIPLTQLTLSPLTPTTHLPSAAGSTHIDSVAPAPAPSPATPTTAPTPATTFPAPSSTPGSDGLTDRAGRRTRRRRTLARAARGSGFTRIEVDNLLDLLETIKPIGRDEWETVARRHNENNTGVGRTVESLRRKFAKLYNTNMGTGNPHMPDDVTRAIHIATAITQQADVVRGDDISEDAAEIFADDDSGNDAGTSSRTAVAVAARPLVLPRQASEPNGNGDDDLVSLARMMMLQDQRQREADREQQQRWREEGRRQREQDRADDRERSNRIFELLATALVGITKVMQANKENN